MRIFHIATAADWRDARASGAYPTSSRGVSLADEGFIHASRADQLAGVYARYYAGCDEPLVVLEIDTDLLRVPCRGRHLSPRVRPGAPRCGGGGHRPGRAAGTPLRAPAVRVSPR